MKYVFSLSSFLLAFFFFTIFIKPAYASCLGNGVHGCGDTSVCCSGLLCQMGGEASDIPNSTHYCSPISDWVPPMTMGCGSIPGHSQAFFQTNYTFEKFNNFGAVEEWCDTAGLECDANLGCVAPPPPQTCSGEVNGYCSDPSDFCTRTDYTYASSSYTCNNSCCRPMQCSDLTDLSESCSPNFNACPNGKTETYTDGALSSSCSSGLCCASITSCNTTISYGTCNANPLAANTCGFPGGNQTQTYTQYVHSQCGQGNTGGNGYTCTPSSVCNRVSAGGNVGCTPNPAHQNNCNAGAGYTCNDPNNGTVCVTSIFVHVYTDYSHTATNNGGGKQGVFVSDGGGNNIASDGSGNVTFTGKAVGNYTISETVPANFLNTNATSQGVSLTNNSGNATVNFYLTPLYSISGRVFVDQNKNQKYDGSDTGYGGGTIHITGGPTNVADITVAGDGTWSTPTNLESGSYTVAYNTSLAAGYNFTTPSSYVITVGNPAGSPACNTGSSLDATCGGTNSGSIGNLDIGVTNDNPWEQSVCLDVRDDSGNYTNQIPAAPSCGGVTGAYATVTNANCSTGAGIVFTCDAAGDFGLGSPNVDNWTAGGAANQQECYSGAGLNVTRTSYDYLLTTAEQSGITPIDLSTICSLASCTLPNNLSKGIYIANGNLSLNAYTFPVDPANPQAFIFLINGDLTIFGNILVPAGSVAAFSAKGNIIVSKTVGQPVTNPSDPSVNDPNLEGLYSADNSFMIHSYTSAGTQCNADGTPLDKKLNIVGSVITNAAMNGGSLQNNRDLCEFDTSCSSLSLGDSTTTGDIGLSTSYLLTLYEDGQFLNHQLFNWEELKP